MKTNKILMVGVLDVPNSTNVFMAKGFEQLGYEVHMYNYRTRASEVGVFPMWNDFKNSLIGTEYDLILFCKTNQMHPQLLEDAKMAGPTWYWFMDPLMTAKPVMAQEYARHATYASATSSEVLELFKAVNPNSFQIIEGYDPDIYFYEDLEKIYDITFIGNGTLKRLMDMSDLIDAGINVTFFGQNWTSKFKPNPPVFNEDERRVINQSKIVLNLCHSNIFSDRVVKSLGCGALVLSQDCEDINREFHNIMTGRDPSLLQLWDTPESAHHLIDLYLKDTRGLPVITRNNLAGYMQQNYSWKSVCQKILNHTAKN